MAESEVIDDGIKGVAKAAAIQTDKSLVGYEARIASAAYKFARFANTGVNDDPRYSHLRIDSLSGSGHESFMFVPTAYKDAVELNLVPYASNVGSYLQAKGLLGSDTEGTFDTSDAIALGLDMTLDAGNLIPLGTGIVATKIGTRAKLISKLVTGAMEAGKVGLTGGDVVDAAIKVVEEAGKYANVSSEILDAAKLGDRAALKSVLKGAAKAENVPEAAAQMIADFKGDRKALSELLDQSGEVFRGRGLKPQDIWQSTYAERVAKKQISPIIGIVSQANPLRNPGTFLRQVVGMHYEGDTLMAPGSRLMGEGLDKILPKVEQLPEHLSFDAIARESDKFNGILAEKVAREPGTPTTFHAAMHGERLLLAAGQPTDRLLPRLVEADVTKADVDAAARSVWGLSANTDVTEEMRTRVRRLAVLKANGRLARVDAEVLAARGKMFEESASRRYAAWESLGMQNTALETADLADLRAVQDSFDIRRIVQDPQGAGNALDARVRYVTLMASTHAAIQREIVRSVYPNLHDAEHVTDIIGRAAEHLELFEAKEGRLTLKPIEEAALKEQAPRLHALLYGTDRRMLNTLSGPGLDSEVSTLVSQTRNLLDGIGGNLKDEGVIGHFLGNYFPLVMNFSPKFYETFGLAENNAGMFFQKAMAETGLGKAAFGDKFYNRTIDLLGKAKQGTVSMQEMRIFTEEMAVAFEHAKYGTYEKDSIKVLGGYIDAAHKSLVTNQLIYDLPNSGLHLTADMFDGKFKKLAGRYTAEELAAVPQFTQDLNKIPVYLRETYQKLTTTKRLGKLIDDPEALWRTSLIEAARGLVPEGAKGETGAIMDEAVKGGLDAFDKAEQAGQRAQRVTAAELKGARSGHLRDVKAADKEMAALSSHYDAAKEALDAGRGAMRRSVNAARQSAKRLADAGAVTDAAAVSKLKREAAVLGEKAKLLEDMGTRMLSLATARKEAAEAAHAGLVARFGKATKGLTEIQTKILESADTARHAFDDTILNYKQMVRDALEFKGQARVLAEGKVNERIDSLMERFAGTVATDPDKSVVYAFHTQARPLLDSLNLLPEQGYGKFTAAYDRWNRNLKAVVLAGDLFHVNTLAMMQMVGAPENAFKVLFKDAKMLPWAIKGAFGEEGASKLVGNAAAKALMGAVAGGLAGQAFGADSYSETAGFMVAGALYGASIGAAIEGGKLARREAMTSPHGLETLFWMGHGGWVGQPDDRSIGVAAKWLAGKRAEYMANPAAKSKLVNDVMGAGLHFLDAYESLLWGTLHNGGKMVVFEHYWQKLLPKLEASEEWKDTLKGIAAYNERGAASAAGRIRDESMTTDHVADLMKFVRENPRISMSERDNLMAHLKGDMREAAFKEDIFEDAETIDYLKSRKMEDGQSVFDAWRSQPGQVNFKPYTEGREAHWMTGTGIYEPTGLSPEAQAKQFYLKKQMATEIMQSVHNAFGGQRYAALFADPQMQTYIKRFIISPDWTASRLQFTAAMLGNLGPLKGAAMGAGLGGLMDMADAGFDLNEAKNRGGGLSGVAWGAALGGVGAWWAGNVVKRMGVKGDVYAGIARKYSAAALLGGFVTYNLMNYEFTGHWMHENASGDRLAVQLPNGQQFTPGKPFLEAFEFATAKDPDLYPAPFISRLASKVAPPIGAFRILFNRDYFGAAVFTPEQTPAEKVLKFGEVVIDSTIPIGLQSTAKLAGSAVIGTPYNQGDVMRAVTGMAGLPFKGKEGVPAGMVSPSIIQALTSPSVGDTGNLFTSGR